MVLSSISPLFILWAIRGNNLVPDRYFLGFCALMVALPNGFLWARFQAARRLRERREIVVGKAEDHRDHLLVYLLAMLLPLYTTELSTWRDLAAAFAALGLIVFLFWQLDLHYVNVLFTGLGLRVYTVYPPQDENPLTGKSSEVLITRRITLPPGERLVCYRLSDTVYLEAD